MLKDKDYGMQQLNRERYIWITAKRQAVAFKKCVGFPQGIVYLQRYHIQNVNCSYCNALHVRGFKWNLYYFPRSASTGMLSEGYSHRSSHILTSTILYCKRIINRGSNSWFNYIHNYIVHNFPKSA